jgi:formylglycine-generating enzyme required for sulfatase activity/energy-coupling factor transporter ATP-binding protein EcfA2
MVKIFDDLPLAPFDPSGECININLNQVYVDLDSQTARSLIFDSKKAETRAVLAAAFRNERLIILGDPGSGKSTFLKFLGLCLAQARLHPQQQAEWRNRLRWPVYPRPEERQARGAQEDDKPLGHLSWEHPLYVPVLVPLRKFADVSLDVTSPLALWELIRRDLAERGLDDIAGALYDMLGRGQAILLLDGVDEVPPERRRLVWQAIGALAGGVFNQCRWIATCRELSFVEKEAAAARADERVTLAALKQSQISKFINAWYDILAQKGNKSPHEAQQLAAHLVAVATQDPRVGSLAQNPMLLTIMAIVQTYRGTLPRERAKLYQACLEIMLVRWQVQKEGPQNELPASLKGASLETLEALLQEIGWEAHHMQSRNSERAADIPGERVFALARKHLKDVEQVTAFMRYTEERAHLLIGRGGEDKPYYSFPHRTFQEYLAGCYLSNQDDFGEQAVDLAAKDIWREVLLLAAGNLVFNMQTLGHRTLLTALADILPEKQPAPGDTLNWQLVWRAGEMLAVLGRERAENYKQGQKLLPRARPYLAALLDGGELTPPERAEAGQALAALGDPRPGVGVTKDGLPDIAWRLIAPGEFIMGEGKAAHQVTLSAFEISQYPITNIQFDAFVTAGGYQNKDYWPEAKKAGYWLQEGKFKGLWDDEPRDSPYSFGSPFDLPNHPVVGVSWYEAVAFCRWLSEKLGRPVRLPSEAEWEKAARGVDGRRFPWGNQEETASRCNMRDTGIGSTCAVGIFPTGKNPDYDVWDMSGNVWEWCSTIWDEEAYPFQVRNEWTEAYLNRINVRRVLRGGAFNDGTAYVRCASRSGYSPNYWGRIVGFRVVLPPIF